MINAVEIAVPSPEFAEFLETRGSELCALRLIPHDSSMPKLRTRGASIRDSLGWFEEQKIDATKYKADFVPHSDHQKWSTIFVVNKHGAFGQIVAGAHSQLTQGFFEEGTEPISFAWDGATLQLNPEHAEAKDHIQTLIEMLRVKDADAREKLVVDFGATFFGEMLCGYFETTTSEEFGVWFVDWNRLLGAEYADENMNQRSFVEPQNDGSGELKKPSVILSANEGSPTTTLHGNIGSRGTATGRARVIRAVDLANSDIEPGDILVTDMTTPDFLPLMQKAGAVVTEWGGILSHAAIVCREMKKPCLTNVKGALDAIDDGVIIEVDAENGRVMVL